MEKETIPESLLCRILDGKCILFLGAGATCSSGGVTGQELGKFIFDSLGETGVNYDGNLALYTEQLVNKGYREQIEQTTRTRFSSLSPNRDFCKLAQIPWKAIYTTNYDDLVEKAYKKQSFFTCVVNTPQNVKDRYSNAEVFLYKINGDINTPYAGGCPLTITLSDLRDRKNQRKVILQQLMKDMNDTFVFVGYSFQDENEIIQKILEELDENERWESVKEKYVIIPSISEKLKVILESYKIKYIQCTADDFFSFVSKQYQDSFNAKLVALGKTFQNIRFFKDAQPADKQYISDCFDLFDSSEDYPADGKYYYRGGAPTWGIIKGGFDIARNVKIEKCGITEDCDSHSLYSKISDCLNSSVLQKIKISGPAASGKTTAIYRIVYDLINHGYLGLIFKQQAKYKNGLLSRIFDITQVPFAVFVDNIFIDSSEATKMLLEAQSKSLPITFVFATRNSDWYNKLSVHDKSVFDSFDLEIEMSDTFDAAQAKNFVNQLIECGIIHPSTDYSIKGYENKIKKAHNIVDVLFEIIDNHRFRDVIATEYDSLQEETKFAYGIVSLVYRYGYKIQWEILQNVINASYPLNWDDFVEKILHSDAKGNFYEDELQGYYFLCGRNRYICDIISEIHFEGNFSKEIDVFKEMIKQCANSDMQEKFMNNLLYSIIKDEKCNYSPDQLCSLLDYSLNLFRNERTKSLLVHIKGEFLLKGKRYDEAIECFESNVNNDLNVAYSLHSLGKTYFYKAQQEVSSQGKFRNDIDIAIKKLFKGLEKDKTDKFNYGMLLLIFNFLREQNRMSERDELLEKNLEQMALTNIGKTAFDDIKAQWSSDEQLMDEQ